MMLSLAVAELEAVAPWSDVLFFMLLGFMLVMVVLAALSTVIAVQGKIFVRFATRRAAPAPETASAVALSAPESVSLPGPVEPEILAVIAAAVTCVLDQPHRILSVQPAPSMQHWSIEGRRQIFASHKVR